jgi:hypothetical protein
MSSAAPASPAGLVSCVDALNALFSCGGPAHQLDRYYKDGRLDGCAAQLAELRLCAKIKAPASDAELRELVRVLLVEAPSPTVGVVWPPATTATTPRAAAAVAAAAAATAPAPAGARAGAR